MTTRPPRRLVRSALAILAGMTTVVALSMGADEVMYATHVFPPRSEPMHDPRLFALALAYRAVFGVAGSWVAARVAPHHPMRHALIVGGIGLALSALGAIVTRDMDLGPAWYSWGLAASTLPCAWLGGRLAGGKA
ncbi:hypothetical protein [Phenylobacterium sp.]|uniref:hypothetical protein n=1 Tax=Phenylobacterium sp. TaxID=1871053 RepID=UPI0025E42093|nr:hypothetical protein [Phenylobacterium sp.]